MTYDFNKIIERRNTYSMKYDPASRGKPEDVIPLWVADMDFPSPPPVLDAIKEQANHGIFGYLDTGDDYFKTLQNWFSRRHDWVVEQDWLVKTPGVVSAIHIAILALTELGDSVLIQQPVYYPFMSAVSLTGRQLVVNELVYDDHRYHIDFDDFEKKITKHNVKAFILCNPHNPVGRVFTNQELTQLGDICFRYGVVVIADEIHQDFVYAGHKHLVFAGLKSQFCDITVTCTAPTKTFNLAGLPVANIFISNKRLRERFMREYTKLGVSQIGVMEIAACRAAYEYGDEWLDRLLEYLWGNMVLIEEFLEARLSEIKLIRPEGSYLAWLDFSALGLSDSALDNFITHKARLWLHRGTTFGMGGEGFMRLNAACPRPLLCQTLERLEKAIRE